jgi:hypothetical protein
MNARAETVSWLDANQRYLVAHFARLKAHLAREDDAAAIEACEAARRTLPQPAAIDVVVRAFGLSEFERDVLLLAAGCEMDAALARAAAQGRIDSGFASFAFALAALREPHWSALAPGAPLRFWRLLEPADDAALTTSRLHIDERILHFLAGIDAIDVRLAPLLQRVSLPTVLAQPHRTVAAAVIARLVAVFDRGMDAPCLQLVGSDPLAQRDVAAQAAHEFGLRTYALAADDVPAAPADLHALALLLEREALLAPCAWLIDCDEVGERSAARKLIERLRGVVFVAAREPLPLARAGVRFRVDKPDAHEQRRLWRHALGERAAPLNGALDAIAAQFRLSAQTIAATGALLGDDDGTQMQEAALWQICRALGRPRLDDLALRIEPRAAWDDLVLPQTQKSLLRQLVAHVRHRLRVYDDWGFAAKSARGLGVSALFAGESGTGKTMAAEVLARELQLDLYRIDLSSVVSKYIGETEKNLRRVFDAAEDAGAVLLFDEADALFGKRSEVKDSHDRYANIEVSYLLQRMEAYRGLAILTTNMKGALDGAFLRRLRFVVHFPFPDQAQREAIWRSVLPAQLPTDRIDCRKLAQLHVAGGAIRNIALNAAFLAADRQEAVAMPHLLQAAHAEAAKRERPLAEAETRGWM